MECWVFGALLFLVINSFDECLCQQNNLQPKIVTDDGNIKFQSAKNRNISFILDGDAHVHFGTTSFKDIEATLEEHTNSIEQLIQLSKGCSSNVCGDNGVCVSYIQTNTNKHGYKCICKGLYTGQHCETFDPCAGHQCQNNGICQNIGGRAICSCVGEWFGVTCSVPRLSACHHEVKEKIGVITSPGYPETYPSNTECTWDLEATPGRTMQLIVMVTSIGVVPVCTTEYLQMTDISSSQILATLCGQVPSQTYHSISSKVQIKFKTGALPIGMGFSIFFSESQNSVCGGRLTEPTSTIKAVGTSTSQTCIWVIDTQSTEDIVLKFKSLTINNAAGECKSYLEIRTGQAFDSPVLEKICHSNSSKILHTKNSKLFMKFVSKTDGNGFVAKYFAECGGIVNLQDGQKYELVSPYFPNSYPQKLNCKWVFHADQLKIINIRFVEIDIESHKICGYDKVTVENGESIFTFCGNADPSPLSSTINRMVVGFDSDGDGDFKGFKAIITVSDKDCSRSWYASQGLIHSPQYPSYYRDNKECVYTISSNEPGNGVTLNFLTFSLEDSANCMNDNVEFFDGSSIDSPKLFKENEKKGMFCGSQKPALVSSTGRTLTVRFRSNQNTSGPGFAATWKSIPLATSEYLTSDSGIIQSPSYPNQYQSNVKFATHIESKSGHQIELTFQFFHLESSADCNNDYLSIYDGPGASSRLLGKFCGDNSPDKVLSNGNNLYITFKSDASVIAGGYYAQYKTVNNLCGGVLHGEGILKSPGYPQVYPPNLQCDWKIKAKNPNNIIKITIIDLDLENSPTCLNDYLEIYDGLNRGSRLVAKRCGIISTRTIYRSSGRYLSLTFISNGKYNWKGFNIKYEEECYHVISARTGQITSPNYPLPYPANSKCTWVIKGYEQDQITLQSQYFDLDTSCNVASLSVSDNRVITPVFRYCDSTGPSSTFKSMVTLRFMANSDGTLQHRGFKISYTTEGCYSEYTDASGTFSSPNYPSLYPVSSYCVWKIIVGEGKRISLQFTDFDLETICSDDFVSVYNGGDLEASKIGTYCSRRKELSVESSSNHMTVLFKSNESGRRKGFSATYRTVEGGCRSQLGAEKGNIYSPGYPSNYPRSSSCQWTINVNTTQRIFLQISPLDLLNSNGACSNFLEILDGITFNQIKKYCQSTSGTTQLSTGGNKVVVKFSSDSNSVGKPFNISYSLACGGEINIGNNDVTITSPHYPNYYERGVCQWLLVTSPGKSLFLTFDDFSIEKCSGCSCAYLQIQDGSTPTSPVIGPYCGEELPRYIISSGNNLLVTFNVSTDILHTGFKATISSDPATCGGTLTNVAGNFISPLYPNPSPKNADCIWKIKVSEGSKVFFRFESDFQEDDCNSTYINIFDGSTINDNLLSKVCNAISKTTSFLATGNTMTIQYFTTKQHAGFAASYSTNCLNIDINDVSGYIESPNYPRFYPSSSSCSWNFNIPEGNEISFTFEDFDTEPATLGYCFDGIAIDNKDNIGEKAQYCGGHLPSPLELTWRNIIVSFNSDGTVQRHGFKLKYSIDKFVPNCGGNIIATEQTKYITSPDFPKDYSSFKSCIWDIKSYKPGLNVMLYFNVFNIEEDEPDCRYDYLEVNSGPGSTVVKYCGQMAEQKQIVGFNGQNMILKFKSDFSVANVGFNISYTAACYHEEKATKGIIKSNVGSITQGYEANQHCRWNILHSQGGIIILRTKSFDLEQSVNCSKDYVLVKSGVSDTSPVIGRFCGKQLPMDFNISNHEASIIFVSDDTTNGTGFELEYERHIEGCGGVELLTDKDVTYVIQSPNYPTKLPSNAECEWQLNVPQGKLIEFRFQTFNISSDSESCSDTYLKLESGRNTRIYCGSTLTDPIFISTNDYIKVKLRTGIMKASYPGFAASWRIGCGGKHFSPSGKVFSTNFPKSYNSEETCDYGIQIPDKQRQILLHFNEFDLQGSDANCLDYVKIYDDLSKEKLIGKFCGKKAPFSVTAPSNVLLVEFKTDNSSSNNRGFSADYQTVGEKCGGDLIISGTFASPLHPSSYPTGRHCVWNIDVTQFRTDANHVVELNIETMNIAESVNCTQDYLQITNGLEKDSPILGRYCGQVTNKIIWSSGPKIKVEFVSNRDNLRGSGFKASFKQGHKGCGGRITGSSGYITSAGFGTSSKYLDNSNCIWVITASDRAHVIQLEAVVFEIEEDESCSYDKLVVRDGYTADSKQINVLCGNKTGEVMATTSGPNAYIRFTSDSSYGEKGFNILWSTNSISCGGLLRSTSGTVKSPDYPLSYFSNLHTDCVWTGKIEPSGGHVVLSVSELNIPLSDNCDENRLVIQNGLDVTSPVVATLCGNLSTIQDRTVSVSGTHFRIHLISSNVNVSSGGPYRFEIGYRSLGSCGGVFYNDYGTITSPGYPTASISSQNCEWVIRTTPGKKILIHIDDIDLKGSCTTNNVKLFDGATSNDALLATLCNVHIQDSVYEATSNFILIQFQTSFFITGKGFKLRYNTSCGGVLKGRQGFTQSPGYPGKYPENINCEWIVDVQPHYSVRITKADIRLPPTSSIGICNKDVILIREGTNSSGNLIGQFCGDIQLENYMTTYHQVYLNFQSDAVDDGVKYLGGKIAYDTVCGEHIKNSLTGKISFKPNGGYDYHESCVWLIEFPVDKKISLSTIYMELENAFPSCFWDRIEIRDGLNESFPLIGRTCGEVKFPHVQSSGNYLYIKFTSDHSVNQAGFEFEYSEAQLKCGGKISTETSTTLTSPTSSISDTFSYETCGWSITVPTDKRVQVMFDRFDIPEDFFLGTCLDFIYIYDAPYPIEQYRRTSKLCGDEPPTSIITITNSMYIFFNYQGVKSFNATIKAVDEECGGKYVLSDGESKTLTMNNIASNKSCEYMFVAPVGKHVSIKVTTLKLESGNCKSKLVLKGSFMEKELEFCGEVLPPIFRGSQNQVIMLLKNMQPEYSVTLEYTTLQDCDVTFTASHGLVTSPNYPLPYPNNVNCKMQITANEGQVISLYPVSMDLQEPISNKCFDFVDIYDSDEVDIHHRVQNRSFCGRSLPPSVVTSGKNLLLTFTSNLLIESKGFAFTYLSHSPNVCGGSISGQSEGAVSTPGYPAYYSANLTCDWSITVGIGKKIQVNVEGFETEHSTIIGDCTTVDYLELFDSFGESFGKFCGTSQPANRTTSSNTLSVKFTSNSVVNDYKGFRLTYIET